jgi:3D (Asp-Asp-Asp) domain-containing protein
VRWIVLAALVCAGCDGAVTGDDDDDVAGVDAGDVDAPPGPDARPSPDAAPPGELLGSYRLTYYWVTSEEDHPGAPDTDLYDDSCDQLATVSSEFFDSLRLEGTGRLLDGRVLNYWGACPCATSPCFFEVDADHPWGVGSMNRALVPFRSIAVDRDLIAIGAPIYVAELDGIDMPGDATAGAFTHDGCVTADDTGGGINGAHIDLFVGLRDYYVDLNGQLGLSDVTLYEAAARCAQ